MRHDPDRWLVTIRIEHDRIVELDVEGTLDVAELRSGLERQLLTRM